MGIFGSFSGAVSEEKFLPLLEPAEGGGRVRTPPPNIWRGPDPPPPTSKNRRASHLSLGGGARVTHIWGSLGLTWGKPGLCDKNKQIGHWVSREPRGGFNGKGWVLADGKQTHLVEVELLVQVGLDLGGGAGLVGKAISSTIITAL